MLDDRFDDLLREAAQEYNSPPQTPREAMWSRIVAARAEIEKAEKAAKAERRFHPLALAAGIAAVLGLGIALGRLSSDRNGAAPAVMPAPIAIQPAPGTSNTAYQVATTEHLSQSEAFLTLFRASLRPGGNQQLASATARQLLATNRLLLDSPAATDVRTRALLQDLELVLAEIAQLSPQPRSRDLELISEGLEQGGVLSRLRTAVPAGASPTRGVL